MAEKRKVRLKGEHLTHQTLWHTAERFLEAGCAEPVGRFYPLLATVVFAYFAFEAYLNTALRSVEPNIWAKEREFFRGGKYRGTLGKFKYLAEVAGLTVETSRRPFQTARTLNKARDFLAHAKVEEYDEVVPATRLDEFRVHRSVLDKYTTPEFASKAVDDIRQLSDALQRALVARFGSQLFGSDAEAFAGISGGWHASLVEAEPMMPNKRLQPTAAKPKGRRVVSRRG